MLWYSTLLLLTTIALSEAAVLTCPNNPTVNKLVASERGFCFYQEAKPDESAVKRLKYCWGPRDSVFSAGNKVRCMDSTCTNELNVSQGPLQIGKDDVFSFTENTETCEVRTCRIANEPHPNTRTAEMFGTDLAKTVIDGEESFVGIYGKSTFPADFSKEARHNSNNIGCYVSTDFEVFCADLTESNFRWSITLQNLKQVATSRLHTYLHPIGEDFMICDNTCYLYTTEVKDGRVSMARRGEALYTTDTNEYIKQVTAVVNKSIGKVEYYFFTSSGFFVNRGSGVDQLLAAYMIDLADSSGLTENMCIRTMYLSLSRLYCWGSRKFGILRSNSGEDFVAFEARQHLGHSVGSYAISRNAACVVRTCGAVRCWGSNEGFRLGRAHPSPALTRAESYSIIPRLEIGCLTSGCFPFCGMTFISRLDSFISDPENASSAANLWDATICLANTLKILETPAYRQEYTQRIFEAFKAIESSDSEAVNEAIIEDIQNKFNRALLPEPRPADGLYKLPVYSMERTLRLTDLEQKGLWSFSESTYWITMISDIGGNLATQEARDAAIARICNHVSDNFIAENDLQMTIEEANFDELYDALEASAGRMGVSSDRFKALYADANTQSEVLKVRMDEFYEKIEEFQSAYQIVAIVDAVVAGFKLAADIFAAGKSMSKATKGLKQRRQRRNSRKNKDRGKNKKDNDKDDEELADDLKAAAEDALSAFESLVDVYDAVSTAIEAFQEVEDIRENLDEIDRLDVEDLNDAGALIDTKVLQSTNLDFWDTLSIMTKEILFLSSNVASFLETVAESAESIEQFEKLQTDVTGKIPSLATIEPTINPLFWDTLVKLMRANFEEANVCIPPYVPGLDQRRRLSQSPGHGELRLRSAHSEAVGTPANRVLADKAEGQRVAAKEARNRMEEQCEVVMLTYEQMINEGKAVHSELVETAKIAREIRISMKSYDSQLRHSDELAKLRDENCDGAKPTPSQQFMRRQLITAEAGLQSQIDEGIERLLAVCDTIQYLLNPIEPVCVQDEIREYVSLYEVSSKYEDLKSKFQAKWESFIRQKSRAYGSLDVTKLIDMDALRSMNTSESITFTLNPEDVDQLELASLLSCRRNVEVKDLAVVFRGTTEPTQEYSTITYVTGPFHKVRADSPDGELDVGTFIPLRDTVMSFSYKVFQDNTCDSSEGEMTKICGRQICQVAGTTDVTENQKYVLPSIFATYTTQVTTWGNRRLKDVKSVHLVYKGRWAEIDGDGTCTTRESTCEWNDSSLGLIVGVTIAGCVGLAGGGYFIRKKMKDGKSGVMTALPVYGKDDGAVNPSFTKEDIIQANDQAFTPGNAAQNGMNKGRTNRFFSFRGPGSARALFGRGGGGGGGQWSGRRMFSFRSGQRPSNGPNNSGQGFGPNGRGGGRGMFGTSSRGGRSTGGGGYGGYPSSSSGYGQQQSGPNSFGGRQGGPPVPDRNQMMVSELAGRGVGRGNMYGGNPHMRKEDTIALL